LPLFGRLPLRTARQLQDTLHERGLASADSDAITLGGFTIVATSGSGLTLGAGCAVRMRANEIELTRPDGTTALVFRYTDVEQMEIAGRGPEDPDEQSGSVGRARSDGLVSLLNAGGGPRRQDTVLRLVAGTQKVVLKHPRHTRPQLRRAFAPALMRWESVRRAGASERPVTFEVAVEQLEHLGRLRAGGRISDAEFEELRRAYVHHLAPKPE
jgi:hypothetical protein